MKTVVVRIAHHYRRQVKTFQHEEHEEKPKQNLRALRVFVVN
jgi:hypothetical protein